MPDFIMPRKETWIMKHNDQMKENRRIAAHIRSTDNRKYYQAVETKCLFKQYTYKSTSKWNIRVKKRKANHRSYKV